MIKLRLSQRNQTTFPKLLRDCLGVKPGDSIVVEIENGQAILRPHRSGAGMLSRYANPSHGRSVEESVGQYLGALDAKTRSRA